MGHRLSKSRYTSGLQCVRQLWWRVHEPDAPELVPDAALQAVFDQGHLVGEAARERSPGGVLIDVSRERLAEACEETRQAIEGGADVIYEASFFEGDVFVAVDLLERTGAQGAANEWRIVEVKSSTKVKDPHLDDTAVQLWVVRRAGLDVGQVTLMHLNRGFRFPDEGELFVREDVPAQAEARQGGVPAAVARQLAALAGELPEVGIGDHCDVPYACPFKDRCWPPLPDHHISTLYYGRDRVRALEARGITLVADIPDDEDLLPAQRRQRRAVREGRMVVDPGLREALRPFAPPVAYLDFETVAPALPRWNGCRPYDPVPVQFSCHVEATDGSLAHRAWIADGPEDPREALAKALLAACGDSLTVAAYYAKFERARILELAAAVPHLSDRLTALAGRVRDLLTVVRDHVYHPDFGGGFGLKAVLPALVPELRYEDLEVSDGMVASTELSRMMFAGEPMDPAERARLRSDLLAYCALDTKALVALRRTLATLAETEGTSP
ncbi:MAG: DUF2779 domain-containing protein [Planctomycetota bacterium]|jgi:predicted RecB family nuclease